MFGSYLDFYNYSTSFSYRDVSGFSFNTTWNASNMNVDCYPDNIRPPTLSDVTYYVG